LAKEEHIKSLPHDDLVLAAFLGQRAAGAREQDPLQNRLLATKFFIPAPARNLITRARLDDLLEEARSLPLTLVSAPAGFGKTTLLANWARLHTQAPDAAPQAAWLSLDESDREPRRFWMYVLTALDKCQPSVLADALRLLEDPARPGLDELLTALINALSQAKSPCFLILDNYHLADEPSIHASLNYLLEHQPPQLHLILLTRTDPPLNLSRLRANDQLLEIRSDQLRCDVAETAIFLKQVVGIDLAPSAIAKILDRTEGWLVGMQLLGLSLRSQPGGPTFIQTLNGSQRHILDYLTEEVYQRQPGPVQQFLLRTSFLERLSASLCDAVSGQTGSQEMLEYLERSNLFLTPLDDQRRWYRYHSLFAEALSALLEREDKVIIPDLHLRASLWLAEHNQVIAAIRHALQARAYQVAADLMEALTEANPWRIEKNAWGPQEEIPTMLASLQQLPAEIVQMRPRLGLYHARLLSSAGRMGEVEAWVQAAEIALNHLEMPCAVQPEQGATQPTILHPTDPSPEETLRLRGEIAARRAFVAGFYGQAQLAQELCQTAESSLTERDLAQQALLAAARGQLEFSQGQAGPAIRHLLDAGAYLQKAEQPSAVNHTSQAASLLHMQGRLHEAYQLLQQTIELASPHGGPPAASVGAAYICLADVLREWNQLDQALDLAQQGMRFSEHTQNMVDADAGYLVITRIFLSQGNLTAAQQALRHARQLPTLRDNPYRRTWLSAVEQARVWLQQGELETAAHWSEELLHRGRPASPMAHEREDVARARILLALGQPQSARQSLASLAPLAAKAKRFDTLLEIRLLEAQASALLKDEPAVQAALSDALRMAEPEGAIRRFVDEGPALAALLARLRDQQHRQGATPYLDSLLAAFPKEAAGGMSLPRYGVQDPLSEREFEVLREMAIGSSNQEIAGKLVLSVETIKRHVGSILTKLESNNRTQAVARARSLGLL
jgi:LuxR family maltose regulon positive regulatory protein